jgi:hypothetical protein
MKRIFYTSLLICILFPVFTIRVLHAQTWSSPDGGTTVYKTSISGNVGIGTTTPTQTLHVFNGSSATNMLLEGTYSGSNGSVSNFYLKNSAGGALFGFFFKKENGSTVVVQSAFDGVNWIAYNKLNYTTKELEYKEGLIDVKFSNVGKTLFMSPGNVGIGLLSPSQKLDVSGSINITGNYKINGNNLTYSDVGAAASTHNQTWSTITSTPTTIEGYGIVNTYTKTDLQTSGTSAVHFNNLTNKPTTISGYGISDAYIKTEVDTKLEAQNQLSELSDVTISGASTDQVLKFDGTKWINAAAPGGGGGSGTVTSVALSMPSQFAVSGSPVTTSGTLTASWNSQSANCVFAGPNGTSGAPTFRTLVAADIPSHTQVWSTITATPTTISGYGISNAYTKSEVDSKDGAQNQLSEMTDVTITSPATDQILKYDGTKWINSSGSVGGGDDGDWTISGSNIYSSVTGNVGIGETNPSSKLVVNGVVKCKEVKVTLTGWSDFVFDDHYNLPSLYAVESYIQKNKHLPGVPSESKVISEGINLGKMDSILLQKIEELTLHLIEMNKRLDALETENKILKQKLSSEN